ncbi:hypothetical protein EDB94_0263 [Marinobacter sp. 3-2]|jgi:hypothetical protein|nr:hypothetical protein EDB94_0263 [Marinobacter sp. 3-2]
MDAETVMYKTLLVSFVVAFVGIIAGHISESLSWFDAYVGAIVILVGFGLVLLLYLHSQIFG